MNTKEIRLKDIIRMTRKDLMQYKLHLACYNGKEEPLDVFLRDNSQWLGWNEFRSGKNDFNREFIFCMIKDYHHQDQWIFGGVLRVVERFPDWKETGRGYRVEMTEILEEFRGRLIIDFHRYQGMRGRSFRMETFFKDMSVHEILDKPYEVKLIYG